MIHFKAVAPLAMAAVFAVPFARAGAQTASQDAQAAALLSKHRAYVGWQFGDGTFHSLRISGDVTGANGEKMQTFVMVSVGLLYRNTYAYPKEGDITDQTGFTGNVFWRSDMNGFTTPVYGGYARYLASFTVLQQEGTTELPATFIGDRTIDGKPVGVVRVSVKNGDAIDCYVDRQTGAYVAATIDPGGAYETTIHIVSYRDVLPGKKMMASYRIDNDASLHAYERYQPNIPISDDALHPPAATAFWSFANYDPFPIALTHLRILVDGTVNGIKGRFLLDTGASSIVLDEQFADRVKAPALSGSGEAGTVLGPVKSHTRRTATITFGGATLHDALVHTVDFRSRDYRGLDGAGYDGLIGYDLFAGTIVKLDVYNSKMTILDPSDDVSNVKGLPLIVDLSEGIPTVPMTLNRSIAVNAILDTGNPGLILFGPDLRLKHHLKIWGCGYIESLTIGPITYSGETACEWGFAANDMLLGYDFLKHFDYVFDYPHGRMFMTPNKN